MLSVRVSINNIVDDVNARSEQRKNYKGYGDNAEIRKTIAGIVEKKSRKNQSSIQSKIFNPLPGSGSF